MERARRIGIGRPLAVTSVVVAATTFGAVLSSGCSSAPLDTPVRSLQSSGPVSFVCLGDPAGELEAIARPLSDCGPAVLDDSDGESEDDFRNPHLYALVTQPILGQVAVVDLSTAEGVIDVNVASPGKNFLPVGAIPTDIVSTPGGTASFVSSAEPSFERLYALPSDRIRGGAPTLTSWPACALPAAPGEMELVLDPADGTGAVRPSCDAAYGDADDGNHDNGDLSRELLDATTPGRLKLLVSLPSEGGIAVIDAQEVLDRATGTSDACVIERWLPLEVALPPAPPPPTPQGQACVPPETVTTPTGTAFEPLPAGMTAAGGRLYVADRNAPVIHRVQIDDPCDPHEIPPLVTSSAEDPFRVVVTSEVAVSPLTLDLERFLYAVDLYDGSLMVYDVSDGSGRTTPLQRPNAAANPFQPRDRVFFGSPPRELVSLRQQRDNGDPETGSTLPVRCDPDPDATGPATTYRTSSDYESGASPFLLRGVFTLAVLENGDIAVIDVDDFDAPCRGPSNQTASRGCEEPLQSGLVTSDEYSCRTVSPHEPRSGAYLVSADGVADREPGINAFPLLFSSEGTVVQLDAEENSDAPRMRALTGVASRVRVGSGFEELDDAGLAVSDPTEQTLVMNLSDPRAHIVDQQDWSVTYEGTIPGFGGRFAELVETEEGFQLSELTSAFCSRGVQSRGAIVDRLVAPPPEGEGLGDAAAISQANPLADYVQVFSDFPVESDPYWDAQDECTFNACNAVYGSTEAPREARDLRILEAYEDTLELEPRASVAEGAPRLKCCMPGVVEFRVRAGRQWTVVGSTVRFLHRMTIAEDGTCRPSCDPISELENARVREAPSGATVSPDDPAAFINPFFQFAINAGDSQRDMQFRFTAKGGFAPLILSTVTNDENVQPTAATFLPVTRELVVSDGSLQGITFIDLDDLVITRQIN